MAGAIAAFDEAAKVDPKDARPPYLKGVALEKKGDNRGATAAYTAAIARKADFAEAHNNLGALLLAKGDAAGRRGRARGRREGEAGYAEAQYNLGVARDGAGQEAGGGRRLQGGGAPASRMTPGTA